MAEKYVIVSHQLLKPIKILKWKVRKGSYVQIGKMVLVYEHDTIDKEEQHRFRSTHAGILSKLIAAEGAIIQPGEPLFELQPCNHSTVMKDMCAECGADLRKDEIKSIASVPMIHTEPDLKVSQEIAEEIGRADNEHLLKNKKLVLLVDLDQTLIHTTNDIISPNLADVHHFQLYGPNSPWYHTRLRPGTIQFLTRISQFFELHICTFGARNYAHKITAILDSDNKLFSERVLSRDECFDSTSKTANLKALFPCGDNMVCIIDDREDVWSYASNLIHVKPYHFFKHTGDINAPPGLEKHENDEKDSEVIVEEKPQPTHKCRDAEKAVDTVDKVDGDINTTNSEEQVTNSNEKVTDPSEKVTDPSETVTDPSKKVTDLSKTVTDPSKTVSLNGTSTNKEKCDENSKENIVNSVEKSEKEINSEEHNSEKKIEKEVGSEEHKDIGHISDPPNISPLSLVMNSTDQIQKDLVEINLKKIEPEDPDDYLLYLEDILKRIHTAFYRDYANARSGEVPDLKTVIPAVKRKILEGCNLIFSGLVATHIRLEKSKAFQIAKSLGANVSEEFDENTTHLVAVRPGTAKVNAGKKRKNLKIVTPDWLWTCAERWEHVNEQIFPLNSKGSRNRHPPPHCSSPEHIINYEVHDLPGSRKRSPSGRFMDTINPLLSFSVDDIADMDKDVEAALDDDSESEADRSFDKHESSSGSSSSSEEFASVEINKRKRRRFDEETDTRDTDELPSAKFYRGEQMDSDVELEKRSDDDSDDVEWDRMGERLETEFCGE